MTTTAKGRRAEALAAEHLTKYGYIVLEQNWRTRWCEVDIVAQKDSVIYFVEVKYRRNGRYGDGLDAITPSKLRQMQFAAQFWVVQQNWLGNYQLAVVTLAGAQARVTSFLTDL